MSNITDLSQLKAAQTYNNIFYTKAHVSSLVQLQLAEVPESLNLKSRTLITGANDHSQDGALAGFTHPLFNITANSALVTLSHLTLYIGALARLNTTLAKLASFAADVSPQKCHVSIRNVHLISTCASLDPAALPALQNSQ